MTPPKSAAFFFGRTVMAIHKYAPGQTVKFSPDRLQARPSFGLQERPTFEGGIYTIVRTLPEQGNTPQYRIKAKVDGPERVAREDQLDRV